MTQFPVRIPGMAALLFPGNSNGCGAWSPPSRIGIWCTPAQNLPHSFIDGTMVSAGRKCRGCVRMKPEGAGSQVPADSVFTPSFLIPMTRSGSIRPFQLPEPAAEIGHSVHHVSVHPQRSRIVYMQKHRHVPPEGNLRAYRSTICPACSPWRCRPCHDSYRASGAPSCACRGGQC